MNVLFLAHRVPYAPNRGDRVRAFHLLAEMSRWASVDLVALAHDAEEAARASDLRDRTRSVTAVRVPRIRNLWRSALALPTPTPLTHTMLHAPGMRESIARVVAAQRPDVVFCYCTGVAPAVFRPPLADLPVVLDMVDVDSAKWQALGEKAPAPLSWLYRREARVLSGFERRAMARAHTTLVVAEREHNLLRAMAPEARVQVMANGIDVASFARPTTRAAVSRQVVVFCGVLDYEPNVEGALWLAESVWPLVRARVPEAWLHLVGARPVRAVRRMANEANGVRVMADVPDVRPYLWDATVATAPLHTARGLQNKVLEALAAGLPVVVTPAVAEGLPEAPRQACQVAEQADRFAEAVRSCLTSADRVRQPNWLGDMAWPRQLAGLHTLLLEVTGRPTP